MTSTAPELNEAQKVESKEKELATQIHELLCSWNHIDGCGWYYTKDDGNWQERYERKKYLDLACELMSEIDSDVALKVITTLIEKR